ncbi:MAG: RsmE family RNA methyltransferase [Candidatus Limnocylindria bacterium]
MHRFFVDPSKMAGERFTLPDSIAHQVQSVLRLRDGDRLVLLPGDGTEAECVLVAGSCEVVDRRSPATEPRHRLIVVQALLKGDGLDEVIRHATEVGVAGFQLVVTERCVAREISALRLERLRAIARESAEQSERALVPWVAAPIPLESVLEAGAVILADRTAPVRLSEIAPPSAVIIGPEGGWAVGELRGAGDANVALASLGPRILRSRSVASVAAGVILSRTGDFA